MLDRYHIVNTADLREAALRLDAAMRAENRGRKSVAHAS
jgi:hypothetical protein